MEAPVETVNKRTEVTGSVFGEIERMVSAAQTGLEVAKNRIDPVEFWQILRLATVRDDCPVLAEPASVTPAKQLNPSEVTIQSGARLALAQPETALRVKPGTGAILIYRGRPSALSEMAATKGTLFSEPRPALPPANSPPR